MCSGLFESFQIKKIFCVHGLRNVVAYFLFLLCGILWFKFYLVSSQKGTHSIHLL